MLIPFQYKDVLKKIFSLEKGNGKKRGPFKMMQEKGPYSEPLSRDKAKEDGGDDVKALLLRYFLIRQLCCAPIPASATALQGLIGPGGDYLSLFMSAVSKF